MHKPVSIPIKDKEPVSGILSLPQDFDSSSGMGVILAHGAGNDMHNPLLTAYAAGLARSGILTLRFNFPYKEKGKKAPDSPALLQLTWRSVFTYFQNLPDLAPAHIFAAGKSMGGRVASQMVAMGTLPAKRLIFLGYPLHPPGRKQKLRDAHLYHIQVPMLFFAGTRDPLCDLGLLEGVLNKLPSSWTMNVIEGGDHSFNVPKALGVSKEEIYEQLVQKSLAWLK